MVCVIVDYIESKKEEMLEFLEKLVNIDSGSNFLEGVNRVGSVLCQELEGMGLETSVIKGNRYGNHVYAKLGTGKPGVLLMGHMDTVFPAGTVAKRCFSLDSNVGRAHGPGVEDMKSGIVVMIYAVKALLECRSSGLEGTIKLFLNSDEEPGSPESRRFLSTCLDDVEWAFVFEPASPNEGLVTRRKGVGIFRFWAKGRAAHAGSEPEAGANAIEELISKLIKLTSYANRDLGTSINIGTIKGGKEPYIVPDSACAAVDVRVPTLEEQKRIERAIKDLIKPPLLRGTELRVGGGFHRPPMNPAPGTEEVKQVICNAADLLGCSVTFSTAQRGGATDGNLIVSHGIPCIDTMGPVGGGAHTDQEYIEVKSLYNKTALTAVVLDMLLGTRQKYGNT
jgi:glutamate carboxypeptidase